MAATSSFDVVSKYDQQEVLNALDQTRREIQTRYDLKDSRTTIEHEGSRITITTDGEYRLQTVRDLMETKFIRRGLSLKVLKYSEPEPAAGGNVRQTAELVQGIDQDLGRRISKAIRDSFPKVQPQIQGDAIRITAKSRDELQSVIQYLKSQDYPVELQFVNYR